MARLLKIVYGSLTLGKDQADASYHLTGKYQISEDDETFAVTFEVVVSHATRSTFLTAEATLRTAYTTRDQTLTVTLGSTNRHNYVPGSNTGFLARPSLQKIGGKQDTANSARYRCTVSVRLPFSLSGRSGRRNGNVLVDETPSGRKRVAISGEYTALSSNSAREQYEEAIATWQTTVLADLGTVFDLATNTYDYDEQDKVLRFRRVLVESLINQAVGTTDVASLRDPKLIIRRQQIALQAAPGMSVRPPVTLLVQYDTWVDEAVTTDLPSLYTGTIRPFILSEVYAIAGSGGAAVVRDEPSFDRTDNRISVSMDVQVDQGGQFYQARVVISDRIAHGIVLVPVWSEDPYDRDAYQGPATHVKVVRRTTVGRPGVAVGRAGVPALQGFVELEQLRDEDRFDLGTVGDTIALEAVVASWVFTRANVEGLTEPGDDKLQLGFTNT